MGLTVRVRSNSSSALWLNVIRIGPIKKCFPTEWKELQQFFFESAEALGIPRNPDTVCRTGLSIHLTELSTHRRMADTTSVL